MMTLPNPYSKGTQKFFRSPLFVCVLAATLLTLPLHQECVRMVRSNRVAQKRPARGHSRNGHRIHESDVYV